MPSPFPNYMSLAHVGELTGGFLDTWILTGAAVAGMSILCIVFTRLFQLYRNMNKPRPFDDNALVAYVSQMAAEGVSEDVVRGQLRGVGWEEKAIAPALAYAYGSLNGQVALSPFSIEVLRVGAVLTFFAHSVLAFIDPDQFVKLLEGSGIFHMLIDAFPGLIAVIGINDLLLALFLASGKFPRVAGVWATLWIGGVLAVLVSQKEGVTLGILADILEHGAPLGIAVFFAFLNGRDLKLGVAKQSF